MTTPIPFIDLTRTSKALKDKFLPELSQLLENAAFLGGKPIQELEELIKKNTNAMNVMTCANGTDALILALQARGIGPGKKVALPNLTFWATYEAVANLGATPVLIDVDASDLQLSFLELQKTHGKFSLDACILVHLFGWCSKDLFEIRNYCNTNHIFLLEDAAQAYGTKFKNESVLKNAEAVTFSFYPAKVIGGCMDGGAISSTDPEFIEKCKILANHGRKSHYSYSASGWNSRMSAINAKYLTEVIKLDKTIISDRRLAQKYYVDHLSSTAFEKHFKIQCAPHTCEENGYLAILELKSMAPEELASKLDALGIKTGRVYPETIAQQEPAARALKSSELNVSTEFCKKVINLPLFWGITKEEQDFVISKLKEVFL